MSRQKSITEAQRDLVRRVHTEGARVAYETSLAICRDPAATPSARATASATLFRVGGYFDRNRETGPEKEPHEMTPGELQAAIRNILDSQTATSSDDTDDGAPVPDVFS